MSKNSYGYAFPEAITRLRIYRQPCCKDWQLDGVDAEGNYTESQWEFDSFQETVDALPQFAAENAPRLNVQGWLDE